MIVLLITRWLAFELLRIGMFSGDIDVNIHALGPQVCVRETLPRHEEKFTAGEIQWAQVSDVCHERFLNLALGPWDALGFNMVQYGSMSMC